MNTSSTGSDHSRRSGSRTWLVVSILLISLILRWILIFRGGQYYISDETRYEVSRDAARLVWQGQLGEALKQLTISPEHLGFKVAGILPAMLEPITGPSLVIPAMFFSLFSILNLYLIFSLARRAASPSSSEPLFALLLAASCLSLLYYSRHLFPYDMAMSFGLLALSVALAGPQNFRMALACGSLSFLCFITYNGYWPLAAFSMLVNTFVHVTEFRRVVQRAVSTATGFLLPLALLIVAMNGSGTDMISAYRLFATSITQGSFEEGWSLPFAYFWYTEHSLILILGVLSAAAIINAFKAGGVHTAVWAGGILFIYGCLVIPSVFLHYFVVYGRLARQMIPFLVLLSAKGLARVDPGPRPGVRLAGLITAAILVQAAGNFITSYDLSYPREFVAEAQARFPEFEFSSKRLAFGAPVICQDHGYIMENAKYYVDPPKVVPKVQGQLLLSAEHPSNFRPYQYDGDLPATRQAFDTLKLTMNFYKADELFITETNQAGPAIMECVARKKE